MNEDDLKFLSECESVCNIASPEPWTIDRSGSFSAIFTNVLQRHNGEEIFVKRQVSVWGGIKSENDLRFAIVARSAMSSLCTMVREQDKRARHAEAERDAFNTRIGELETELCELRSRAGVCGGRRQDEKHLEKGGSPYVFASDVPDRAPDKPCNEETIETFSVVLSKPWGG